MAHENGIAIVGLAGRFPGAADPATFWLRLRRGDDLIARFNGQVDPAAHELARMPGFVAAGGIVEDIDLFDAGVFRMSADEAAITDPQHRLFLECALEALEDAGYGDPSAAGLVAGVYAGSMMSSYAALAGGRVQRPRDELHALVAAAVDYMPMLASYRLDLRGESIAVQTACSTSLVAVHLGCQSLLTGQSDLVIAGGASIDARQRLGYIYEEGGTLSPDGQCRPFSADARGTVRSFGVGLVVLRRLEDAVAAGDPIRAVICGSAVTNDGRDRIGFVAPGVGGQTLAIATALAMAGVEPESIGYVECHGTATPMGDAMEVEALTRAFKTARRNYCQLGAVKANAGHLSEASGIAALVKAVLALEHGERPGIFNYGKPNPAIDFSATPFRVERETQPWPDAPRRAGVSSYAVGGTNAHLVLEQAPAQTAGSTNGGPWTFALSAASEAALGARAAQLAEWLRANPAAPLNDVAFTLARGRRVMEHRRSIVARTREDLLRALARDGDSAPDPPDATVPAEGRRLHLPTYPFQRARHWLEAAPSANRTHGLTWWLDRR